MNIEQLRTSLAEAKTEQHSSLILEFVTQHLLAQGVRSVDPHTDAELYHGANGGKCAVGCLIDDDHYTDVIEHKTATEIIVQRALAQSLRLPIWKIRRMTSLLTSLQEIHDQFDPEHWERKLLDLAARMRQPEETQ